MTSVRQLLRDLDLGSSVAEFDDQLESYFVQTQPFLDLINNRKDVVAGDKGTGKTAIFKYLHKKYKDIPSLQGTVVLPAFNPTGNPIFQQLAARGALDEQEYGRLWKSFVLSLVGNWLLKQKDFAKRAKAKQLDQLLRGLELRSESDEPTPVFQKIMAKIGDFFNWKSAEMEVQTGANGLVFKPRVEFADAKKVAPVTISVEAALSLLNACLAEAGTTVWVAIDRLDEAFQGAPEVEVPALRALFRTYLDLLEFDRLRLKLFVRRDLFSRIVAGGFVNLTHVHARTVEVIWDEADLISLLCRRVRQNASVCQTLKIAGANDDTIFSALFPLQVDQGSRKPDTHVWIMSRIRDGNGIKPPRNLIDLVSFAKEAQLRTEDRSPRDYKKGQPLFEPDALKSALAQLSDRRVNDTLLAEARELAPVIEKFRKKKAEQNLKTLSTLIGGKSGSVKQTIKSLCELGFLEETGQSYKVPMLYRGGLEITQGKAFGDSNSDDE